MIINNITKEELEEALFILNTYIEHSEQNKRKPVLSLINKLEQTKTKKYTNFDKIINEMKMDKIAKYLKKEVKDDSCPVRGNEECDKNLTLGCEDCIMEWLQSEVKGDNA